MSEHTNPLQIPDGLESAFKLFVAEMEGQLTYIRKVLNDIDMLRKDRNAQEKIVTNFHRIRGAAGFLGLHQIKDDAKEAEIFVSDADYNKKTAENLLEIVSRLEKQHGFLEQNVTKIP